MDIELGPSDFLSSFGCKKLSAFCLDLIAGNNFKLTKIQGVDCDKLIIEIIERILQDTQVVVALNRTDIWFNGLGFGSLMMEGYNLFVWKKKKS
jgi:hypothetical protein